MTWAMNIQITSGRVQVMKALFTNVVVVGWLNLTGSVMHGTPYRTVAPIKRKDSLCSFLQISCPFSFTTFLISRPSSSIYLASQCQLCYRHIQFHCSQAWRLKRVWSLFITHTYTHRCHAEHAVDHSHATSTFQRSTVYYVSLHSHNTFNTVMKRILICSFVSPSRYTSATSETYWDS